MKIAVVYYSMYGNTYRLARAVAEGAAEVADAEVKLYRAPELLPQDMIDANPAMKAAQEEQADVPEVSTEDLAAADGLCLGSPTRFGNMAAQLKQVLDQTAQLWMDGSLIGKPAGVFCCTASLHGGQETTCLSMMLPLIHHGMIVVGVPYSVQELITTTRGGTPYGPTAVVGPDASQRPTAVDLSIAGALGRRVAEVAAKLRA